MKNHLARLPQLLQVKAPAAKDAGRKRERVHVRGRADQRGRQRRGGRAPQGPGRGEGEKRQPQRQVGKRPDHEGALDSQRRHQEVSGDADRRDGAEGVRRVNRAHRALAAGVHQFAGEQRQGHSGANRGRQHHRHGDEIRKPQQPGVSGVVARQDLQRLGQGVKQGRIGQQRQQREGGHGDLHPAQKHQRVGGAVGLAPHRQSAQRQPQDEGGKHQLKGVRGGAQQQRQHSHPDNFIDQRRESGDGGGGKHHRGEFGVFGRDGFGRRRGDGDDGGGGDGGGGGGVIRGVILDFFQRRRGGAAAVHNPHGGGDGDIDESGEGHGAGQSDDRDEDEGAGQHADGRAERV